MKQSGKSSNWGSSTRKTTPAYRRNRLIAIARDSGICQYCFQVHGLIVPGKETDHVIPTSRGGTDDVENLNLLCLDHHRDKTQRESNGLSDFTEEIDMATGWPLPSINWVEVTKQRTKEYFNNMGV